MYHEWAYMYQLNNGANNVLALVDKVVYKTGDANIQKNTIKAWCYWWKGFAYSRLGSMYYAGVINNDANVASNVYVSKEKLIAEANSNFDKAATILKTLSAGGDYAATLNGLIPDFCQVGKGGLISPAAWLRNINTMKARNILVNTPIASMTAAQWGSVLTLVNDGIQSGDLIFTGRTNTNADIWNPTTGTTAAKATGSKPGDNTYKISERLIQDFKRGDKRLDSNFIQGTTWIGNSDRGISFNTRWYLKSGGTPGIGNTIVYSNLAAGATEIYLAGTYEENELMKAEAKINTNAVEDGLGSIDAIRTLQGSGLAAVKGTGLTAIQAREELRRERRSALAFRGFSFYDARRAGILEPNASRTGCVVLTATGVVNTNATIKYGFLDYWDVPDNELAYNKPAAGSDPTKNPK
jgi:starch-binding outer membrane protein, SusD/RagB family